MNDPCHDRPGGAIGIYTVMMQARVLSVLPTTGDLEK
jgi:hypothetical protein